MSNQRTRLNKLLARYMSGRPTFQAYQEAQNRSTARILHKLVPELAPAPEGDTPEQAAWDNEVIERYSGHPTKHQTRTVAEWLSQKLLPELHQDKQ